MRFFHIKNRDNKGVPRNLKKLINILNSSKNDLDFNTIKSLQSLRTIGNAGAHMSVNKDRIVKVKPNEAKNLLRMIEILFDKTYIARAKTHNIEKKLKNDVERYKK